LREQGFMDFNQQEIDRSLGVSYAL